MRRPKDRLARRAIRDYYISYRRKIRERDSWHHKYEEYLEYLEWQNLSDDDKKIREVEAVLDGIDPKSILPDWSPTVWGKFAKWNLVPNCKCCRKHSGWGQSYKH